MDLIQNRPHQTSVRNAWAAWWFLKNKQHTWSHVYSFRYVAEDHTNIRDRHSTISAYIRINITIRTYISNNAIGSVLPTLWQSEYWLCDNIHVMLISWVFVLAHGASINCPRRKCFAHCWHYCCYLTCYNNWSVLCMADLYYCGAYTNQRILSTT